MISAIGTWQLVFTICQRGLEDVDSYQYESFAVIGFILLLSYFGLVEIWANVPAIVYLLAPLMSILGLPHSVVYWINWVTCRLTMFLTCGFCICRFIGTVFQLRCGSIGLRTAISWCVLYALSITVSFVMESDKLVIDQLLRGLTNSTASLPAYCGFSAALGQVALILGTLVHCCIRASLDVAAPSLEVLYGFVVFNTLMFGVDIYLFSQPLSDTVSVVAVFVLTSGLLAWIPKNTDSYVMVSVARRSNLPVVRVLSVCLFLFVFPLIVTYLIVATYGPTHWSSITCLPLPVASIVAFESMVKNVIRLVDSSTTWCLWSNVDHTVRWVEVSSIR